MKCKCGCNQITPIAKRNRYELGHTKGKHIDYCFAHALRGRKRVFTDDWKNKISQSRLKSGISRGSNNPNWQGGKTKLQLAIRNLTLYKQWRKDIYARDNYSCISCGVIGNGKNLQADHILPLSIILIRGNIKSISQAEVCKEIWDTSNGRTLCVDCHKKTDSYGWKATNNYMRKLDKELAR